MIEPNPDQINGMFELIGGLLILLSCRKLYRDKQTKGVSVLHWSFYCLWGFWNLYFYPACNAPWSFYGGIVVVAANSTWVCMAVYFNSRWE